MTIALYSMNGVCRAVGRGAICACAAKGTKHLTAPIAKDDGKLFARDAVAHHKFTPVTACNVVPIVAPMGGCHAPNAQDVGKLSAPLVAVPDHSLVKTAGHLVGSLISHMLNYWRK